MTKSQARRGKILKIQAGALFFCLIAVTVLAANFKSSSSAATTEVVYKYDDLNRLTSVETGYGQTGYGNATTTYTYDEVNNIINKTTTRKMR